MDKNALSWVIVWENTIVSVLGLGLGLLCGIGLYKLAELGLGIDVQGNGLARSQSIPAGAEIKSGQSVTVTFSP